MKILHKNKKEDLKVLVFLGDKYNGEYFSLTFTSGSFCVAPFVCSYNENGYKNCEKVDDTHVMCLLDNHGLPSGLVTLERTFYLHDGQMPDGDFRLNEKGLLVFLHEGIPCHLELGNGKSDPIDTPETTVEVLGTIIKGEQGDPGTDGTDGTDAYIAAERLDEDGNTIITWNDGHETMIRRGKKGDTGENGKDGTILYPTMRVDSRGHVIVSATQDPNIKIKNGHLTIRLS